MLETLLVVFGSSTAAGVVQALTGFGAGIVQMLFFPMLLPMLSASALSGAISLMLAVGMAWQYRKHIRKDLLIVPAIVYAVVSALALSFADLIDTTVMLKIFGAFLILLSVYFLFFSGKIRVKANVMTATVCASLSGVVGGLFGIGGPPMVIYYLAAMEDKREYLGTIQAFFCFTNTYTLIVRLIKGFYTVDLLLPTAVGIAAILLGQLFGGKIQSKINGDTMRKLVYAFLGVTGVINLLK